MTNVLLGRRETTKARNRDAILAAAREAFAELGYEAASLRDIIRGSGLSTGTLYNYFRSKEEIAAALAADAALRLRPILRAQREAAAGLESYLDGVIRAYFRFLVDERGGARSGRTLAERFPPMRITTPAQRAVFDEVHAAIAEALRTRLPPDADSDYLAAAAIGAARSIGQRMLGRGDPDPDAAARVAVRLLLDGLPATAGPHRPDLCRG